MHLNASILILDRCAHGHICMAFGLFGSRRVKRNQAMFLT